MVQTNPDRRDKMERFKGDGENVTRSTGFLTTVEMSACPSFLLTHALITCGTGPACGLRSEQGCNIHVEELTQGEDTNMQVKHPPSPPGCVLPKPPSTGASACSWAARGTRAAGPAWGRGGR